MTQHLWNPKDTASDAACDAECPCVLTKTIVLRGLGGAAPNRAAHPPSTPFPPPPYLPRGFNALARSSTGTRKCSRRLTTSSPEPELSAARTSSALRTSTMKHFTDLLSVRSQNAVGDSRAYALRCLSDGR
jgi:hypothetical protein